MKTTVLPVSVFLVSALAVLGTGCEDENEPEGGGAGSGRIWECQDGADNDQNGLIDCEESSCAEAAICTNEPPTAPGLKVWPESPTADGDVLCILDKVSEDPDGDALAYEFSWSLKGGAKEVAGYVLPRGEGAEGETWVCTANAMDGTEAGPSDQVEVTLSLVTGGVVEIRPPEPTPLEDLFCVLSQTSNYVDGSSDRISYGYSWSRKGSGATDFSTVPGEIASVLSNSRTVKGDEWRCDVQITGAQSLYGVISDTVEITDPLCETFEPGGGEGHTSICSVVGYFKDDLGSGSLTYPAMDFCVDRGEEIAILYAADQNAQFILFASSMSDPPGGPGFDGYIWLGIEKVGQTWITVYDDSLNYANWGLGTSGAGPEYACVGICAFDDDCYCPVAVPAEKVLKGEWCPLRCTSDKAAIACDGHDH